MGITGIPFGDTFKYTKEEYEVYSKINDKYYTKFLIPFVPTVSFLTPYFILSKVPSTLSSKIGNFAFKRIFISFAIGLVVSTQSYLHVQQKFFLEIANLSPQVSPLSKALYEINLQRAIDYGQVSHEIKDTLAHLPGTVKSEEVTNSYDQQRANQLQQPPAGNK